MRECPVVVQPAFGPTGSIGRVLSAKTSAHFCASLRCAVSTIEGLMNSRLAYNIRSTRDSRPRPSRQSRRLSRCLLAVGGGNALSKIARYGFSADGDTGKLVGTVTIQRIPVILKHSLHA